MDRTFIPGVALEPGGVAVDGLTDTRITAQASAKHVQRQQGSHIRVAVKVKARERLTAKASGKIRSTYKLRRRKVKLDAGENKTLKLKPKRKTAKRIIAALNRGETAKAKLRVKLTDGAENTKTEKLRVRLKRAQRP